MHTTLFRLAPFAALAAATLLSACVSSSGMQDADSATRAVIASSFRAEGIAGMDRIANADNSSNQMCSQAMGQPLPAPVAQAIAAANQKTVRLPADGRFMGDWREGERIAQNGRGLTWTDKPGAANGGSCYNCHQIGKAELSFGTIGPSLYQYGKLRGVADPASSDSRAIVEYTWGKLWNAKATNACSDMPRFGHAGILNEQQLRDVMALLLDPKSPVNSQ